MTALNQQDAELNLPEAYVIACLVHGECERALDLIGELGPLPGYAPHLASAGARLLAEQQGEAALRVASRAVELDPACALAHSVVGHVLSLPQRESTPAAEASLRLAASLDPHELAARLALVSLYLRQDRPLEAIPFIEQALTVAPWDGAAREALKRLRKSLEAALKSPEIRNAPDDTRDRLAAAHDHLRRLAAQVHHRRAAARPAAVSLCLITRNEARNLPRVIGSVRGLATEVIVVDTGSTDGTVRVAQRLGARVDHFAWIDDFAAARNHSLKQATGEWILVLDADDELARDSIPALRDWLRQAPAVDVVGLYRRYPYPDKSKDSVTIQPRLFRNGRGLLYEGAIHERLVTADGQPARPEVTLAVTHYHHGIDGAESIARRHTRNLPILLRAIEQHPDDLRASYYVGVTHLEREEWKEAVPFLKAVVDRMDKEIDLVRKAYACLGFALLSAGDATTAEATVREGLEWYPHYPDLWFGLGLVLDSLGRLEDAAAAHEAALRGRFGPSMNWHDWTTREDKPHMALCDLYLCLGDLDAASRHLEAAESFTGPKPYYARVRQTIEEAQAEQRSQAGERERRLAQLRTEFAGGDLDAGSRLVGLLLERGEIEPAREFVTAWLSAGGGNFRALAARGKLLLVEGTAADALESFEAASALRPNDAELWLDAAAALRALGRPEEAEQALQRAISLESEDGPAAQALGELYLAEQRWEDAAHCFRRRLERSEEPWVAWLGLGRALLRSGSLPSAIDCYQRAASLSQGNAAVRRALGEAKAYLAQRSAHTG